MEQRKRRSIIWALPKAEMQKIVAEAATIAEILRYFDMASTGTSRKILLQRLDEDEIDYSHIPLGLASNKKRPWTDELRAKRLIPLEDVMVENSTYNRKNLKRRLLQGKILPNQCAICGLNSVWNGKKIVLILDHINGVNNDHRLENLRLLCPNCNSQLDTHCGKNSKKMKVKQKHFCLCGNEKSRLGKSCIACEAEHRQENRKFDIMAEDLRKLIWEMPTLKIAQLFSVSDKAVEKRCKLLKIKKPPRGYWAKQVL